MHMVDQHHASIQHLKTNQSALSQQIFKVYKDCKLLDFLIDKAELKELTEAMCLQHKGNLIFCVLVHSVSAFVIKVHYASYFLQFNCLISIYICTDW